MQNGPLCKLHILFHKGINTLSHHPDGFPGHILYVCNAFSCAAAQKADDFSDILRLVTDAFHIGYYFQCSRYLPQVPGHRLLMQKKLHAAAFNIPLHLVNYRAILSHPVCKRHVSPAQCFGGGSNSFLAHCAHLYKLSVKFKQLFIKSVSHISQTFL